MPPESRTSRESAAPTPPESPSKIADISAARRGESRRANAASDARRADWAASNTSQRAGTGEEENSTDSARKTHPAPTGASAASSSKSPGSLGRKGGRRRPVAAASRPGEKAAGCAPRGSHNWAR